MDMKFVITLTQHRNLGNVFIPYFIKPVSGKEFFTIHDRVTFSNIEHYRTFLSEDAVRLVKVIEQYSDQELTRVFSKKKVSPQVFLGNLSPDFFEEHIKPYLEKRMATCIDIISGADIPLYHKKLTNNIYEEDKIIIYEECAQAVFNFDLSEENLKYFLSIVYHEKEIRLTGKEGIILVNEPCHVLLDNHIYFFEDIDGKKIVPFFTKESIVIPSTSIHKYLSTFVKTAITKYKVNASGFTIEDEESSPKPVLSLEQNLSGEPILLLKFWYYTDTVYLANKKSQLKVELIDDGKRKKFIRKKRQLEVEHAYISSLLGMGLSNIEGASFLPLSSVQAKGNDILYQLINWLNLNSDNLIKAGMHVENNFTTTNYFLQHISLDYAIKENKNDWFDIFIIVRLGDEQIPFIQLKEHILEGERAYKLPDGRVIILPEEWFSRFKDFLVFGEPTDKGLKLDKQHFPLVHKRLTGVKRDMYEKMQQWENKDSTSFIDTPATIKAELRPYQKEGFNWLYQLYLMGLGGCLADDMGLGKTIQAISLLVQVIQEEKKKKYGPVKSSYEKQLTIFDNPDEILNIPVKTSLVVLPTSLVHNWILEITKFAPSINFLEYTGQRRQGLENQFKHVDLVITTYGLVRNDIEMFQEIEFLYIILDESQFVKNPFSKTYQAVTKLRSKYKLVLTGTPIENSLVDLWSQLNFLNRGILGNLPFFKSEFQIPIERNSDDSRKQKLKTLISPFLLRRSKKEVAKDLPEITEQIFYCNMNEIQQSIYEEEKSKARNLILENIDQFGLEKSSIVILKTLTRLRQIANHPALINKQYIGDSGKFSDVIRVLDNLKAEEHKALVFSSFVKHLNLVGDELHKKNMNYTQLTGETQKREQVIKAFQQEAMINFFLISLKAGGVGLNLTAADYVLILDPWWNPAAELQAINRAHRIGQEKNVFVYRFIARDTIEEKILRLQEKKSDLVDLFISDSNPFRSASAEDILDLL